MTEAHDATPGRSLDQRTASDDNIYELTLFVSGASQLSARAIAGARELCETYLTGCYRLAIVDVYQDAAAVVSNRVVAVPTLVKHTPLPERRFVGNLERTDRVLVALDLVLTGLNTKAPG